MIGGKGVAIGLVSLLAIPYSNPAFPADNTNPLFPNNHEITHTTSGNDDSLYTVCPLAGPRSLCDPYPVKSGDTSFTLKIFREGETYELCAKIGPKDPMNLSYTLGNCPR